MGVVCVCVLRFCCCRVVYKSWDSFDRRNAQFFYSSRFFIDTYECVVLRWRELLLNQAVLRILVDPFTGLAQAAHIMWFPEIISHSNQLHTFRSHPPVWVRPCERKLKDLGQMAVGLLPVGSRWPRGHAIGLSLKFCMPFCDCGFGRHQVGGRAMGGLTRHEGRECLPVTTVQAVLVAHVT